MSVPRHLGLPWPTAQEAHFGGLARNSDGARGGNDRQQQPGLGRGSLETATEPEEEMTGSSNQPVGPFLAVATEPEEEEHKRGRNEP